MLQDQCLQPTWVNPWNHRSSFQETLRHTPVLPSLLELCQVSRRICLSIFEGACSNKRRPPIFFHRSFFSHRQEFLRSRHPFSKKQDVTQTFCSEQIFSCRLHRPWLRSQVFLFRIQAESASKFSVRLYNSPLKQNSKCCPTRRLHPQKATGTGLPK